MAFSFFKNLQGNFILSFPFSLLAFFCVQFLFTGPRWFVEAQLFKYFCLVEFHFVVLFQLGVFLLAPRKAACGKGSRSARVSNRDIA
jgi:hypothetical protein